MSTSRDEPTGRLDSDLGEDSDGDIDDLLRAVAHAPPRRPPVSPATGSLWGDKGRYVMNRRLGRGGMGAVYLATDTLLGRQVALKVLDAGDDAEDEARRLRLLREVRLAASLEHERIARMYDVGEHDGSTFAAMEYVRGITLRGWMSEQHTPTEILHVAVQIAEGLAVLHGGGIMHRDLKPENVMLSAEHEVKLLDFGLAGHVSLVPPPPAPEAEVNRASGANGADRRTRPLRASPGRSSIAARGTPGYMAPEQYDGERADPRTDVFALGVVIFEMVTGSRPFKSMTVGTLRQSIGAAAPTFSGGAWDLFPPGLGPVVARMLDGYRENRFADGAEALQALRAVVAHGQRRPRRWRWAIAGVLLALGALGSLFGSRLQRSWALRHALATSPTGMVAVNVGRMVFGHTAEELDRECAAIGPKCNRKKMQREVPSREMEIAPFFLDAREVTNEELAETLNQHVALIFVAQDEQEHYDRYVRFNAGVQNGEQLLDLVETGGIELIADHHYRAKPGRAALPAAQVTWFGADLHCRSHGKRLPTEDEWEAAARGSENRPYPWGTAPARCGAVVLPAEGMMLMEPGCPETVRVMGVGLAAQDVTPEGIHDLGGNVGEWTDSGFLEDDRFVHPTSRAGEAPRTIRGGSWAPNTSYLARTTGRTGRPASTAGINIGFRCARSPLPTPDTP